MKTPLAVLVAWMLPSFSVAVPAKAKEPVIHRPTLYSDILREKRPLEILLPKDYAPGSAEKYDVLYVLEGFTLYHTLVRDYLTGEGFIPKNLIIVGVPNTHQDGIDLRDRDFAPTRISSYSPVSGGAGNFLAFLKKELIPYVDRTYATRPGGNTLVGGSLAGLFVLYALLNEPALFRSYIALDPSLWWDKGYINKVAQEKLADLKAVQSTLWITGREGPDYQGMGIAQMEAVLQAKAPASLTWKCVGYPNETHFSQGFKGYWDGLKFSYGGYYGTRNIAFKPMNGIVVKDKPFKLWCYNRSAPDFIRYTVDGTEPTPASPRIAYENTLSISQDTRLTLKVFSARTEYDLLARGDFKTGEVLPAMAAVPEGARPGGLHYAYYEGTGEKSPDFSTLKPDRSGIAGSDFDLSKFPIDKSFVCLMEGYIKIEQEGYYIFELTDEGDSKVYLGDQLVIGAHYGFGGVESFMVPLEKGFYPLRIEYFHKKGGRALSPVYMNPPAQEDSLIPLKLLYSR